MSNFQKYDKLKKTAASFRLRTVVGPGELEVHWAFFWGLEGSAVGCENVSDIDVALLWLLVHVSFWARKRRSAIEAHIPCALKVHDPLRRESA